MENKNLQKILIFISAGTLGYFMYKAFAEDSLDKKRFKVLKDFKSVDIDTLANMNDIKKMSSEINNDSMNFFDNNSSNRLSYPNYNNNIAYSNQNDLYNNNNSTHTINNYTTENNNINNNTRDRDTNSPYRKMF